MDRNKPGIIGAGPDRDGSHADEFMLRFIGEVGRVGAMTDEELAGAAGIEPT
ncbi:hypothetical protein MTR72_16230 [Bradyrhizobium sp. ISRA442]|uniref:hypothetical protein n=1 Tax=Bradyrhizobium sp. ISRA442 TaxID=2866197 RepID=UPI00311B42AB